MGCRVGNRCLLACRLALAVAAFSMQPAHGQEDARSPEVAPRKATMGVVHDRAGHPWAGARVVLTARPLPSMADIDDVDTVTVTADERGRFRAALLTHRIYSAWAVGAVENGRYPRTRVAELVTHETPLRLVADLEPAIDTRVTLTRTEAWQAHGPFTARVLAIEPENVWVQELAFDARHRAALPLLPGQGCWIDVFGAARYPVGTFYVPLTDAAWREHASQVASPIARDEEGTGVELQLPPPRTVVVDVRDEQKRPVVGAELYLDVVGDRLTWRPAGVKSDEEGKATVTVPAGSRAVDIMALHPYFTIPFGSAAGGAATLTVLPAHKLAGRVLRQDGSPIAGLPLLLYSATPNGNGGYQNLLGPLLFHTDAQGRFLISGRPAGMVGRLCALPTAADLAGSGFPPYTCPQLTLFDAAQDKDVDLGDLRLDRLPRVDVQLTNTTSLDRQQVVAQDVPASGTGLWYTVCSRTDRRGRAMIVLPKGSSWYLCAATEAGGGHVRVDVAGDERVDLALSDANLLSGSVAGGPGAIVWLCGLQRDPQDGDSAWLRIGTMLGFGRGNALGAGARSRAKGEGRERWLVSLMAHTPDWSTRADSEGRFRLGLPNALRVAVRAALPRDGALVELLVPEGFHGSGQPIEIEVPAGAGR